MTLDRHNAEILGCRACPRLVTWRELVAKEKRAAFRDETYCGKPVPGFGDPRARILVCGLAPAAHGANRTGRVFTGDRSGEWLYRALHKAKLSSSKASLHLHDGLTLRDCYVTVAVRCAPPANKPTLEELARCLPFLQTDLQLLPRVRVIVCLGAFAWDGILRALSALGHRCEGRPKFAHGAEVRVGPYTLLGCYHVSQQNTFTGRLTEPMIDGVFSRALEIARQRAEPT